MIKSIGRATQGQAEMHDYADNPTTDSDYECMCCGHIITAVDNPVECAECGCGVQNRANSLE